MKRSVVYPVRGRSSRVLAALVVGSAVFVLAASTSTAATKVRKPAKKVAATTTSKAPSVSSTAAPKVVVTTTAEPSGGTPKVGGTLTYLYQSDFARGLDPARASSGIIDAQFEQLLYDQLIYVNSAGKVTPGLAESILPAFSFTQWTIKLRPNLKFTDGTPLNADAVVAHFDRIRNPATASPARPAVLEIAKTKIIDQQTIQVTLNDVDSSWNMTFTQQLGNIPSPTAVSAAGAAYGTSAQTAVGAGPFKIVEFVRGDHYTFERNPGYYDAPKPYLDKVIIRPVADHSARYNTFTTGGADMVEYAAAVQQMVDLRAAKYPTATTRGSGIAALALRTDTGPTADVRVREALQRAIDIDAVIARAAPGAVKAESIPDPDGPWANDIPYPGFDRVKAQSLIDAYLKDTNQSSVTLKLIGANTNIPVWEAFKQEWDKIKGLNVVLQIEESAATGVRIATRNYSDMLNSAVPNMPRTVLPAFSVASSSNLTFVKDIPLDVAVGDANATGDPAVQRRAMQAFSKRLAELVPYVLQYRTPFNFFWQKNVQGVELGIASGSMPMQNVWKK